MDDETLLSLSPLDGRYKKTTSALRDYFSEYAFIKYRAVIEVRYLEKLTGQKIPFKFTLQDARRVKEIEKSTKHDVKAIEYLLREKIRNKSLHARIHIGLTSEDVNNLALSLMLSGAHSDVLAPRLAGLTASLTDIARAEKSSAMLARTHGQPAIPTTFGKEMAVYVSRLKKYARIFAPFRFEGKLNGAVGNYNALVFMNPRTDWLKFSREFVGSLGLTPALLTTQILPADSLVDYCGLLIHINGILLGLCQDMWTYISRGLVRQKRVRGQVGSSTMPQKINPIDFENAEGNLQVANSMFDLYMRKFPVSRLQRDLSDSTVKRTVGTAVGHTLLAWEGIGKGLGKISFSSVAAAQEMDQHWEILGEAIQTYFRMQGDDKGYEKVKSLLMGQQLDERAYRELVHEYPVLSALSPVSYTGLARKLTELI